MSLKTGRRLSPCCFLSFFFFFKVCATSRHGLQPDSHCLVPGGRVGRSYVGDRRTQSEGEMVAGRGGGNNSTSNETHGEKGEQKHKGDTERVRGGATKIKRSWYGGRMEGLGWGGYRVRWDAAEKLFFFFFYIPTPRGTCGGSG